MPFTQLWRSSKFEFDELRYALSLKEFEPEDWRDWALIPGHVFCWAVALVWSWGWYPLSNLNWWLRGHCWPVFWVTRWILPLSGGRYEDPNPICCNHCLWMGARRAAVHTYADCGDGEVEAVDECRRCGSEI